MLSLRDKLKAAGAVQKPVKKAAEDCLIRETRVPLSAFSLPAELDGGSLTLMQGKEMPGCRRNEILFLDTETTGLSHGAGTVAFLVGVGFFTDKEMIVRQYLMRDYDEEIFVLSYVLGHLSQCGILCTFNGATFDLPLLEARFTMNRMRCTELQKPHIDLLPVSRRIWKLRLKKCNLTALEQAVLGTERKDDLPGSLVPQRYFEFLKTGDLNQLEDILRHNAQDIISLAHILHQLIAFHEKPAPSAYPEDLFSLGRVYEKHGKTEGARMCYRAADRGAVSALSRARLADSFRREGNFAEAERIYTRMIASRQGGIAPLIAMAKICEYKKGDIPKAIEYTQKAVILASDDPETDMAALQKRLKRLLLKARKDR